MGGLICRCYLQSLCANGSGDRDRDKTLDLTNRPRDANGCVDASVHLVDKVFTYASPHNGIDIAGVNAPDLGPFDRLHVRNFNREVMHDFLALPGKYKDGARVDSLAGTFPAERFFCMIGTNYADYKAFWGLSSKSAGPMSDGLVAIANAAVAGAPRAFAHRSHGGHFGIVNSEEGYQNLRRFLFGQVRVDARLFADELTLRESIQKLKDGGKKIRASYNIECAAQVRGGASWHLHERRVLQASAILGDYDVMVKRGKPVFLFTGYLLESARSPNVEGKDLAFSIHLAVRVPVYEVENKFWFDDHFEGETLFERTVVFHVRRRAGSTSVGYELMPQHVVASDEEPLAPTDLGGGRLRFEIPLGFREGVADPPRPGFRGRLELIAQPWNA
jgi:hypothetical protein